jgi:hypothetical protein
LRGDENEFRRTAAVVARQTGPPFVGVVAQKTIVA